MADGPNVEYKPQGDGPHPTLAGNVLDPGVSADGKMQHGQGVGGTDESQIKKEGMEHIQSKVPQTQSTDPSSKIDENASSGGLAAGSGGLSSSANVGSPVQGEQEQTSSGGGMLDTVKSYLGYGGNSGSTSGATESRTVGEENVDPKGTSSTSSTGDKLAETAGVGAAGAGAGTAASELDGSSDSKRDTPAPGPTTAVGGSDPASHTAANTATPKDSDVTTGAPPTESADPTTKDTAQRDTEVSGGDREASTSGEKPPQPAGKGTKGGLENKDAIPTAGGEKLGEKHWGESKVVPDVPKPEGQEGVASKDGQPNKQTEDNTAKNTGGASSGPGHSGDNDEGKEKLVDKIKDKLHIGGKH